MRFRTPPPKKYEVDSSFFKSNKYSSVQKKEKSSLAKEGNRGMIIFYVLVGWHGVAVNPSSPHKPLQTWESLLKPGTCARISSTPCTKRAAKETSRLSKPCALPPSDEVAEQTKRNIVRAGFNVECVVVDGDNDIHRDAFESLLCVSLVGKTSSTGSKRYLGENSGERACCSCCPIADKPL